MIHWKEGFKVVWRKKGKYPVVITVNDDNGDGLFENVGCKKSRESET